MMRHFLISILALLLIGGCNRDEIQRECFAVATHNGVLSDQLYGEFIWDFFMGLHERNEYRHFYHSPFGDQRNLYLYADCQYLDGLFAERLDNVFYRTEISKEEFHQKRKQINPSRQEYEEGFGKISG